jgi:hypothetical protein
MEKSLSIIILLLGTFLIFFPNFGYCQTYVTSTVEISVSARTIEEAPPPPPGGGGGGIPPEAEVIFKGKAYPFANLTILKNGTAAATFKADLFGYFERKLSGVPSGIYNFGIFAEDSDGIKSVTLSFTVSIIPERITTISGIFISPTISLSPTQVERGNMVDIFGQAFPESQVKIFIGSQEIVKEATTTKIGKWTFKLDTSPLEEREHQTKAMALYKDGEQSPFSQTLSFLVVKRGTMTCWGADLNFDKRVNIVDFSILLYFWRQTKPSNRCADINFDGIVNIIDFSIMMYWWTG